MQLSLDSNHYVKSLTLDNADIVNCDFVFDCSGFHRLIIGKVFDSTWKSYHDVLPVDAAVPFAGVRPAPSLDVSVSVAASFTL